MGQKACFSVVAPLSWALLLPAFTGQGCAPKKNQSIAGQLANTCVTDDDCDPNRERCSVAGFCETGGGRTPDAACTNNTVCASSLCIPLSTSKQICRANATLLGMACNDDTDCAAGMHCSVTDGVGVGTCGGVGASCASNAQCGGGNFCIPISATEQVCRLGQSPLGQPCNDDAECTPGIHCNVTQGTGLGACGGEGASCSNNAGCSAGVWCVPTSATTQRCQFGPANVGGNCNDHQDCASGLLCTVVDGVGSGACNDDADCTDSAGKTVYCAAGRCGGNGAVCTADSQCTSTYCIPGDANATCRARQLVLGQKCNTNADCSGSSRCSLNNDPAYGSSAGTCGGLGASCSNNSLCSGSSCGLDST